MICSTFDSLILAVTNRRNQLISQLNDMKLEYINSNETRNKHLLELEKMMSQLCETSIQQNEILMFKEEQKSRTLAEIEKYEQQTHIPLINFSSDGLEFLIQQIETFGSVKDVVSIYKDKIHPVSSFGKLGNLEGQLDFPNDISIYKDSVYITDTGNRRIQLVSKIGKFIEYFCNEHLIKPHSITITDHWVFVTDTSLNAVLKFQRPTNEFICQSLDGELGCPYGITADTNGELLVADSVGNMVVVMSFDLQLVRSIGKNILKQPKNVKIHKDIIFVADMNEANSIHMLTKSGDILNSIIQLPNGTGVIFMCFDLYNNIIINDFIDNSIKIYTFDGLLVHKIVCEHFPKGIAVDENSNIFCTCLNGVLYVY